MTVQYVFIEKLWFCCFPHRGRKTPEEKSLFSVYSPAGKTGADQIVNIEAAPLGSSQQIIAGGEGGREGEKLITRFLVVQQLNIMY